MAEVLAAGGVQSKNNGLLLYYNPASYYAQRALIVLSEKKLKFKSHILKLIPEMEVHQPWFMKLNPEGAVPVLIDGVKVIPDSSRIIDYLEDNFSNGATPRLVPEKGSDEANKVQFFREEIDSISAKILTYGCCMHQELTENMNMVLKEKGPFFLEIKDMHTAKLRQYSLENPDMEKIYKNKIEGFSKFIDMVHEKQNVVDEILKLTELIDKVEAELASHTEDKVDWWLCSQMFTIADVYLAVLLSRVKLVGLSSKFWESPEGKYPFLAAYVKKLYARHSVYSVVTKNASLIPRAVGFSSLLGLSFVVAGIACIYLFKKHR